MKDMRMLQEKFLMLAEKLGLKEDLIEDINKCFQEKNEKSQERVEVTKVNISKTPKNRKPSEEDIDKMNEEELKVLVKKLIKEPTQEEEDESGIPDGQENSPFVVMMKKKGY